MQVKAVASQTDQSDGIAVRFPEDELPCLSVVQLRSGLAVYTVQQGLTPLWMQPSAFWEDPKFIDEIETRESSLTGIDSSISDTAVSQLSAAEQLQIDFGPMDKGCKRKSRN